MLWRETVKLLLLVVVCALAARAADLALVGGRIFTAPDAAPLTNGMVLIRDGRIASVGAGTLKLPGGTQRLDCTGLVITAGFWNCHVHFSGPKWENAVALPAAQLAAQTRDMFTRWGFTSVVDTGSVLANTKAIRRRMEAGEFHGPMILSAGTPFTSKDATPYYLQPLKLPELESPEQAIALARSRLDEGADAIKIFQGAWVSREKVVPMALELVKAVAAVAHARGKLLLAHPSDTAGLSTAIEGGVDVLTHLVESPGDVDPSLVAAMQKRHMAIIPTFKLFAHNQNVDLLLVQLHAYSEAGIPILFGTDVGFVTDYDPAMEYRLLDRAGLNFPEILAALTNAPAARYGFGKHKGRLLPGMDADLVVLGGDPADDIAAFTDVRYAIRNGTIVYTQQH